MDTVQFFTILGFIVGAFGFLFRQSQASKSDIEANIKDVRTEIKDVRTEIKDLRNSIQDMQKDIQQLNIRMAVIEAKITDINQNVSHLMWQGQIPPTKEAQE